MKAEAGISEESKMSKVGITAVGTHLPLLGVSSEELCTLGLFANVIVELIETGVCISQFCKPRLFLSVIGRKVDVTKLPAQVRDVRGSCWEERRLAQTRDGR